MLRGSWLVFLLMTVPASAADWRAFDYAELVTDHEAKGRAYLPFLDRESMSMGLYRLAEGTKDGQEPHVRDEVYYVVAGAATLIIGQERHPVHSGSIAYVKAEVPHRFVDITDDLELLVIFVPGESQPEDPDGEVFDIADLRGVGKTSQNVWNEFLKLRVLRFGLYLLPGALGGDQPLTHEVDEVNLVVKGSARFTIGDDAIDVAPDSIVYVPAGIPHAFDELEGDFEVLILFSNHAD